MRLLLLFAAWAVFLTPSVDAQAAVSAVGVSFVDASSATNVTTITLGESVTWTGGIAPHTVTDGTGQVTAQATVEVSVAVSVDTHDQALPNAFQLYQSYPNPFNPSTQIPFDVKEAVSVTLKIYDIIGREVRTLIQRRMEPGRYEARFESSLLSSGIYFYEISMGDFHQVKKMILLR